MKVIHHLDFGPGYSGLDIYAYSMYAAGLKLGQERYVCFTNTPHPFRFLFHDKQYMSIPIEEAVSMDNAVHIIHRHFPDYFDRLKNTVFFAHGTPLYIMEKQESLEAVTEMLQKCDITLTSWPSHVQYWEQLTDKPVIYNQPGVDLDYFTPDGPKKEVSSHPLILWADSWRGDKQPWNLLYAMKMVSKELPSAKLKLINIPQVKQPMMEYMIKALKLEANIEYPIEEKQKDVREWYRAADCVVGGITDDGNNVQWEALVYGKSYCYDNLPEYIAGDILRTDFSHVIPMKLDIKTTVQQQRRIFTDCFQTIS